MLPVVFPGGTGFQFKHTWRKLVLLKAEHSQLHPPPQRDYLYTFVKAHLVSHSYFKSKVDILKNGIKDFTGIVRQA